VSKKSRKIENEKVETRRYVKPTMHSEKVFSVGFDVVPFLLCGSSTLWNRALCLS
jgi:hypothetical protein